VKAEIRKSERQSNAATVKSLNESEGYVTENKTDVSTKQFLIFSQLRMSSSFENSSTI
jgi:hypothetical protein